MIAKTLPALLLSVALLSGALGCASSSPSIDFGDDSTGNLLWGIQHHGFSLGDHERGLAYADRLVELYGPEARRIQAELAGFPSTDPPEETFKYDKLNHVGLALLAKGEFLEREGDHQGAAAAYTMVIEEFGYAQFQDFGGWEELEEEKLATKDARGFFKLAEAAASLRDQLPAGMD